MKVDLYFSLRSPYSYLLLPRIIMLRDEYNVDVNFKLVYPLAIRNPDFFIKKNIFTYFGWRMIDYKIKARRLGLKMVLPPRPDPIRQNIINGKISPDQPYIFDICHFLQAIDQDKQLDAAFEISKCIFGGVENWHLDNNLRSLTDSLGLNFDTIKQRVSGDEEELIKQIMQNQKNQLEAGHHGVPLSVYKDKSFFGQDRFNDLIKEMEKDGFRLNKT